MLTENQVVEFVCRHLQARGYDIVSRRKTTEHRFSQRLIHPKIPRDKQPQAAADVARRVGRRRWILSQMTVRVTPRCS